ncbi:MAG: DUF4127 family protein [Bacillota bacterium]
MKKIFIAVLIGVLVGWGYFIFMDRTLRIGLIPLDSRPSNTQYPVLLAQMANAEIALPEKNLDNFLTPANTEALWYWLEDNAKKFDTIIINTNELLNGGLINSRHPESYENIDADLKRLEDFCAKNKKKNIILISILPRLLPSQFIQLWDYRDELVGYAQEADKKLLHGAGKPTPPARIPKEIVNQYLQIYSNSEVIVRGSISLVEKGLVDHYIIGQDDAEEYGLSNSIVREIKPKLAENIRFIHGADELTMMAVMKTLTKKQPPNLRILYTNYELADDYYAFEAAPLKEVLITKLDYLNLITNDNSPRLIIVYTDNTNSDFMEGKIQTQDYSYLGIMDIAYTNKGDAELLDFFLNKDNKINGYSGWNTAGNTIGTEFSHYIAYQNLEQNSKKFKKRQQKQALEAYIKFQYIRYAEDLIYQGILRDQLNEKLAAQNLDPNQLGEAQEKGEAILRELYQPYQKKLKDYFLGSYKIGEIEFTVDAVDSTIELPWARTFEARVEPEVIISIN